jgi:toxin ParE1/3/4
MQYKIEITPIAKSHIDKALDYYKETANIKVAKRLHLEIKSTFKALKVNPFYQFTVKNYRAIPLKKFPYLLFYQIVEDRQTILIIALFNTNQDTQKHPS